MADRKQAGDAGQAEVQKNVEQQQDKGFLGEVPPQPPNEAYSIQSGPESPGALDARRHQLEADLDAMKKEG